MKNRFLPVIVARHNAMLVALKVLAQYLAARAETTRQSVLLDEVETAESAFLCVAMKAGPHCFEVLAGRVSKSLRECEGASPARATTTSLLAAKEFAPAFI